MLSTIGVVTSGRDLLTTFLIILCLGWVNGQLGVCGPGRFGPPACQGVCHCLTGPSVCDPVDGACSDSYCDYGWTQAPTCQKACNNTFGPQCVYICHCPKTDTCDPVNGLCSSGSCNAEWYGAGCQIRLPKLIAPPALMNVSCAEVTVQWNAWIKDYDNGEGPIHSYSIYQRVDRRPPWQLIRSLPVISTTDEEVYSVVITVVEPEKPIQFRIDCNMLDNGKRVTGPPGVPSDPVVATCLTTTPPPTTTRAPTTTTNPPTIPSPTIPPETTTTRSQGSNIFETVRIGEIGPDFVLLNWTVLSNVSNQSVDMAISYHLFAIGDCNTSVSSVDITEKVDQSATAYLLDNLEPWRRYMVTLTAISEFNITDPVTLSVSTGETAPTGVINASDIRLQSANSGSLSITWNNLECIERGGILMAFEVQLHPVGNDSLSWVVLADTTALTLTGLQPYTEYSVRIRYVNKIGAGKYGTEVVFRTAQDVPASPVINSTLSAKDSIKITWFEPVPSNGVITKYGISYTTASGFESEVTLPSLEKQATMTELRAFTEYAIRVRAATKAGWGNYSESVTVRSLQAAPGPPTNLSQQGRNETCIQFDWTEPAEKNGILSNYQISYKQIFTHHARGLNSTTARVSVSAAVRSTVVCGLQEATYYTFEVRASTAAGFGAASDALAIWTLQGVPEAPPRPKVMSVNSTTITLELDPAEVTRGPVSAYRVVVDELEGKSRRRRAEQDGLDLPGYVAAEFGSKAITTNTLFVVGDNGNYGGYKNPGLQSGKMYDIAYVVISELEGLNRSAFSRVSEAVKTGPPVVVKPVVEDNTGRVVGIVLGIFLLLIFLVLLLFFLYRYIQNKNSKYYPSTAYNKDTDKVNLFLNEDDDLLKYWSKTQSFTQRRHVVAGLQYVHRNRGVFPHDHLMTQTSAGKASSKPFISLHKEFYSLPHKKRPCTAANKRRNQHRNRFDHLLAFDHSRVVLKPDEHSDNDYINANYIGGYKRRDAYIAAMSPFNDETVLDFYRMIYQLKLPTVVMITKVEEEQFIKCTQYWPDVQAVVTFENFILQMEEVQQFPDYVVRVISLKGREEKNIHTVTVFDYTSWPEHGVPNDTIPILELRDKVRAVTPPDSPILVHCGTGVGRTGCFIALDALLEQYKSENDVNVFHFVKTMRDSRVSMVRTIRQYAFIYNALFEAVVIGDISVGADLKEKYKDMIKKNHKTGHTYLKDQFLSLQEFTPKLKKEMCSTALLPANINKNRYPDLVPPNDCRAIINTLGGPERTDYINAVFLDSHTRKNHFILTQTPLPSTVLDFWKLIYDYKVTTIVMMEERKTDQGHAQYWPDDDHPNIETSPYVVENTESRAEGDDGQIIISTLRVHNLQIPRAQPREVRLFQLHSWTGPAFVPSSKTVLLDLIDLVDDWQRYSSGDTSPVLVHCSDGATQSGLFCAVSVICSKMLHEGRVDVYHTIKHLKRRRPQIVDQLEQYRFCYKTLWDFISLRLTEKSFSQGSETIGDKLYAAPSLNLSLYSSIYDVDDDDATFQEPRYHFTNGHPTTLQELYREGYI